MWTLNHRPCQNGSLNSGARVNQPNTSMGRSIINTPDSSTIAVVQYKPSWTRWAIRSPLAAPSRLPGLNRVRRSSQRSRNIGMNRVVMATLTNATK